MPRHSFTDHYNVDSIFLFRFHSQKNHYRGHCWRSPRAPGQIFTDGRLRLIGFNYSTVLFIYDATDRGSTEIVSVHAETFCNYRVSSIPILLPYTPRTVYRQSRLPPFRYPIISSMCTAYVRIVAPSSLPEVRDCELSMFNYRSWNV